MFVRRDVDCTSDSEWFRTNYEPLCVEREREMWREEIGRENERGGRREGGEEY